MSSVGSSSGSSSAGRSSSTSSTHSTSSTSKTTGTTTTKSNTATATKTTNWGHSGVSSFDAKKSSCLHDVKGTSGGTSKGTGIADDGMCGPVGRDPNDPIGI